VALRPRWAGTSGRRLKLICARATDFVAGNPTNLHTGLPGMFQHGHGLLQCGVATTIREEDHSAMCGCGTRGGFTPYIRLSGGYIVGSPEPTSQGACLSRRKNLSGCVHTLPGWKIKD
jgi:hypothetical protein